MKKILITYWLGLIGLSALCQNTDLWTAFDSEDLKLVGYKNSEGEVMIEPRFSGWWTRAKRFENIIAVSERVEGKSESYYLTKTGKKIGKNNVYNLDFRFDCENEGLIRYVKNDKMGMLDKNGDIAIPAIYDWLSRKNNGLIWAIKNAEKEFSHKHEEGGCSHFKWVNGEELLLNDKNEILIENFKYQNEIDFYSLQIMNKPSVQENQIVFKGINGEYYVFKNTKKDFENWLKTMLASKLDGAELIDLSMDSIIYLKKGEGWITEEKEKFIKRNVTLLKNRFERILELNSKFSFGLDGLNEFKYMEEKYEKYYDNCRESNAQKYPVVTLVISERKNGGLKQDSIEFLKTEEGYRLIGVNINNGEIK